MQRTEAQLWAKACTANAIAGDLRVLQLNCCKSGNKTATFHLFKFYWHSHSNDVITNWTVEIRFRNVSCTIVTVDLLWNYIISIRLTTRCCFSLLKKNSRVYVNKKIVFRIYLLECISSTHNKRYNISHPLRLNMSETKLYNCNNSSSVFYYLTLTAIFQRITPLFYEQQ